MTMFLRFPFSTTVFFSLVALLSATAFLFFPNTALGTNILSDGDMETLTLEPWRRYGQPEILEKSQTMATDGLQSMHVKSSALNGRGGFQQLGIPIEAGKTYTLTFDYFILTGHFNTWLGIQNSNGAFDGRVDSLIIPDSWQQYSREFTVPLDFTDDFRLMFNTQNSELYIDNVEIIEVIAEENNPPEEPVDEEVPPQDPPVDEEEEPTEEIPEEPMEENPQPEEPIEDENLDPEEEIIDEDIAPPTSGGNSTPEAPFELPALDFDNLHFPTNTVVLNNGETETATRTLHLSFRINGITEFAITQAASFATSTFVPFTTSTTWDLPVGNGTKNFFVHFRTKQGYIVTLPQQMVLNELVAPEVGGSLPLPPIEAELPNATNCPLFQRRVYRLDDGKEFYITPACSKREFKNNYVLHTYRPNLGPIHTTTKEQLDEIPDDTDYYFMPLGPQYRVKTGDLLKLADDPKVYFIVENKKYWIRSETVFYHLGHNWNQVKTVDTEVLDNLEEGGTIG